VRETAEHSGFRSPLSAQPHIEALTKRDSSGRPLPDRGVLRCQASEEATVKRFYLTGGDSINTSQYCGQDA